MSKSLKYVSDFQFPSECGFTGSTGKTMVKGYARGGKPDMAHGGAKKAVANERAEMSRIKQETRSERKDAGEEMSRVRKEMRYDEAKLKSDRPMRKQYPTDRSEPMIKMMSGGMLKDRSKLGIEGNKNPGETKMHTAPDLAKPKTMMKSGGPVRKMADGGAANAMAAFQRDQSKMSGDAMRSIGQQAMQRGQKMDTSGNQLNPLLNLSGGMAMKKGGMTPKQEAKVGKVMGEFKAGDLHSGSKSGPMVKSRKQAIAIAMSEAGKKRK